MAIATSDIAPFSVARAKLSELADQVTAGAEKMITRNGESYLALVVADRLDSYHSLDLECIHALFQ